MAVTLRSSRVRRCFTGSACAADKRAGSVRVEHQVVRNRAHVFCRHVDPAYADASAIARPRRRVRHLGQRTNWRRLLAGFARREGLQRKGAASGGLKRAGMLMRTSSMLAMLLLGITATAAWQPGPPALRAPGSVAALQPRAIYPSLAPSRAVVCQPARRPRALPLEMQWGGGGGRGYERDDRRGYERDDRRGPGRDFRGDGGGGGVRPGDWMCPECGATVFGSKRSCFRCSAPKPRDAQPAGRGDGGGWGGRGEGRGGGRGGRGRDAGPWTRASDDTAEVDENMVLNMMRARDEARAARDFETADDIRAVLREDWGVSLHDDSREWWVGEDRDRGRGAGRSREPPAAWSRSPDDDTADLDEERVMTFIEQRDAARAVRDFEEADRLRDELQSELNVALDDRLRQYWVGERIDKGRNGKLGRNDAPWSRSADDVAELDEDQVRKVMELIEERDAARASRDYATADALRDDIHASFGVAVDDDLREWRVGERTDRGAQRDRASPEGGRRDAPWARLPGDNEEIDAAMVLDMLEERDAARKMRDFAAADALRDDLQDDWGVALDDDVREWWVGSRKDNRDRKFGGRGRGREDRAPRNSWGDDRRGGGREEGASRSFFTGAAGGGERRGRVPFSEPIRRSPGALPVRPPLPQTLIPEPARSWRCVCLRLVLPPRVVARATMLPPLVCRRRARLHACARVCGTLYTRAHVQCTCS